jgi:hypothetical protein
MRRHGVSFCVASVTPWIPLNNLSIDTMKLYDTVARLTYGFTRIFGVKEHVRSSFLESSSSGSSIEGIFAEFSSNERSEKEHTEQ